MRISDPARREIILEKAARLFATRHYHEVRMEDIAQEVGVAKGTLYSYFKDKEALYFGLILNALEGLYAQVEAGIAQEPRAEEKLLVYVRSSFSFFERQPYFLELVQRVEMSGQSESIQALEECRLRFFRLIGMMIRALIAEGGYQTPDPDLAAVALTGMVRQVLRFYPPPWAEDLPGWIVRQFLHGLAVPKKTGR